MDRTEIVCLGISSLDILVKGIKEISLDGQTVFSKDTELMPGGDAMNQAVILSRLGHSTRLFTLTGEDAQRDIIVQYCEQNKIPVQGIAKGSFPTSTSVALITENGERTIIGRENGSASKFSSRDIDFTVFQPGLKVVSVGSLFCSEKLDDEGLTEIFQKAHGCGAVTIADFVMDLKDWTLDSIKKALSHLDYVVPSYDEAVYYTGKKEPREIADVFQKYGVPNVIIKMGALGIYARIGDRELRFPSFATTVVDTTGAGDSFVAGLISGLAQGMEIEKSLRFACAASAINIQHVGATKGIRNRVQVYRFLEDAEVGHETV